MVNNKRSMVNEIRTYGRTELAQLYFPAICPRAAWAKLRLYMSDYPRLRKLLACKRRTFLPVEVSLIFDTLGRPWRNNPALLRNKAGLLENKGWLLYVSLLISL